MRMPSTNRNRKLYKTTARQSAEGQSRNDYKRPLRRRLSRRRRKADAGAAVKGAQNRLKNFRQATILAVAITGFIMLVFAPSEAALDEQAITPNQEQTTTDSLAVTEQANQDTTAAEQVIIPSSEDSAKEAIGALQNLWNGFYYNLPKFLIAIGTLLLAWLFVRLIRLLLEKTIGNWHSSKAIISIISICAWMLAIGVAVSIVAGDIRAMVGSLGLVGLALSWSLQTPIESFTGWLLNSFQGYYRVGDRIRVGEVFGDVYKIDFLTTTVWEIGAPYQPGFVQAEQPTGRLVTFPNNEILTGTVINLTGDFPYVWDELSVAIANESDVKRAMDVLESTALNLLGSYMVAPARQYGKLLSKAGLDDNVPEKPQVFLSAEDSWTNVTIRYLVGARERRKWKSELILRTTEELNKPEYNNIIVPVYPRQQLQIISHKGIPVDVLSFKDNQE